MSKRQTYPPEVIEQMIIDHLNKELSEADTLQLQALLAEDPTAQALLMEYRRMHHLSQSGRRVEQVDIQHEWLHLKNQMPEDKGVLGKRRGTFLWLAASLLLVMAIGLFLYFQKHTDTPTLSQNSPLDEIQLILDNGESFTLNKDKTLNTEILEFKDGQFTSRLSSPSDTSKASIRVPQGKVFQFSLDDGTKVSLNSGSSLRFPLAFSEDRQVDLEGEAYFEVRKQAGRRFIVHTPEMDIQVLGTKFNVRSYAQLPAVTSLLEGHIRVSSADLPEDIDVTPGYELVKAGENILEQKIENPHLLAWINGMTYFYNRPLDEIVALINVSTKHQLRIDNDHIAQLRFSGAFRAQDSLTRILRLFTETSQVRYKTELEETILY